MKPWQAFGYLMVEQLGLPEAEMPFYDASCRRTARRLYRNVMKVGNFKRVNNFKYKSPKGRIGHKVHAFLCIFIDFFYRATVFPSQAFREMMVTLRMALKKNMQKK